MNNVILFFKWMRTYAVPYFINRYIKRMKVTDHGEALMVYLTKVIQEDYQPQDYSDVMLEELFNPNKLTGEDRKIIAKAIFAHLVEFI